MSKKLLEAKARELELWAQDNAIAGPGDTIEVKIHITRAMPVKAVIAISPNPRFRTKKSSQPITEADWDSIFASQMPRKYKNALKKMHAEGARGATLDEMRLSTKELLDNVLRKFGLLLRASVVRHNKDPQFCSYYLHKVEVR